nr:hypothetical protein [Tanacetum cinerariifolium]
MKWLNTHTAAENEKHQENFTKELEIVFANVTAIDGASYSLLQRFGAIAVEKTIKTTYTMNPHRLCKAGMLIGLWGGFQGINGDIYRIRSEERAQHP